ncbi:MAG TPA: hypothetical protein VNJ01_14425 [Bacteriovoracaceae bacterium]|nr:hypothetical protein [Bacteriovoracaceae bacterium]
MKKLSFAVLVFGATPVFGQDMFLQALTENQTTSSAITASTSVLPAAASTSVSTSTTNGVCTKDQSSLPLNVLMSLMQDKNAALDVVHNGRMNTLSISSPKMTGNCAAMINLEMKRTERGDKTDYAVEAKFKPTAMVCADAGCSYEIWKYEAGKFQAVTKIFKPTLDGFKECLKESGVMVEDPATKKLKVNGSAIRYTDLQGNFNDVDKSGDLSFVSQGSESLGIGVKYKKLRSENCEQHESIHPNVSKLVSGRDAENERLRIEADKLTDCKEYSTVAEFISRYEDYEKSLGDVRDKLIYEAAKKSAKAIVPTGKYTEEDLKVMADFDKYILRPKIDQAIALYDSLGNLEGEELKAREKELNTLLATIGTLRQKPFFTDLHVKKLVADGNFDDAQAAQSMIVMAEVHQKLGKKEKGVLVTPELAMDRVIASRRQFSEALTVEKERYEVRTGQVEGKSNFYIEEGNQIRDDIALRTKNYTELIQSEYARMQPPNGYCHAYFRNKQKCIQETSEEIQRLYAELQADNKFDQALVADYDKKASEYGKLEEQGRRHVATQNGEEVEAAPTATARRTSPSARATDDSVYNFNYTQTGAQQNPQAYQQAQQPQFPQGGQQYNPYMYQQQQQQQQPYQSYNPYGYQQPFMGQQSFGGQGYMGAQGGMPFNGQYPQPQQQGGYNFNWGAGGQQQPYPQQQGMPYQQQQQQQQQGMPYWQQPTQAYGQYSMFR